MTDFTPSPNWTHPKNNYDIQTLTNGRYRVRIIRDGSPQEPEFEGGCPIVQIISGHSNISASMTGYGHSATYSDGMDVPGLREYGNHTAAEIIEYFSQGDKRQGIDTFERYLRIFHDGNLAVLHNDTDYTYVAYITRTLWESWGNSGEVGKADMTEWISYLEGDVWGLVAEKLTTWAKVDNPDERKEEWEEIDDGSVWGYYGEDVVKQEAERVLQSEVDSARGYRLVWSYRKGLPPVVTLFFTPRLATEATPIAQFDTMEAGRAALEAHYAKEGL